MKIRSLVTIGFSVALGFATIGCQDSKDAAADAAVNGDAGRPPTNDSGADGAVACPALLGKLRFGFNCSRSTDAGAGPNDSAGGGMVEAFQDGCTLTLVQRDDKTTQTWTATGVLDGQGIVVMRGDFGFTSISECKGTLSGEILKLSCSDGQGSICDYSAGKP